MSYRPFETTDGTEKQMKEEVKRRLLTLLCNCGRCSKKGKRDKIILEDVVINFRSQEMRPNAKKGEELKERKNAPNERRKERNQEREA